MENKRPLILVSNDDGIMAKGISELIKFLRPLGEIVVMAPDAPRSGSGCALTVTQPVHYQLLKKDVGLTVYKCSISRIIMSGYRKFWGNCSFANCKHRCLTVVFNKRAETFRQYRR